MRRSMMFLVTAAVLGLTPPAVRADEEPTTPPAGPVFHLEAYWGLSNIRGYLKRHIDGQWAGSSTSYPSRASLDWAMADGSSAHLSLGLGDLYNGSDRLYDQPEEAYWTGRLPNDGRIWVGKRYVPVAAQVWEYESKYGVAMDTVVGGGLTLSGAATIDEWNRRGNGYARLGKAWGEGATVGISVAAGRGVLYSTTHDRAVALDGSRQIGRMKASVELLEAGSDVGGFRFAAVTAELDTAGRFAPYATYAYGHDNADEQGNLRSITVGVISDLGAGWSVEPGGGLVNGKGVGWLQWHYKF